MDAWSHSLPRGDDLKMRLEKPILLHTQIKNVFQINRVFLRETYIIWSDNTGFSWKTKFIREKPTLFADNVGFLQRNLLYQRETHIIWSDNVSF